MQQKKTIAEAILNVLKQVDDPLTSDEIYNMILEQNLYVFKAKSPLQIVRTVLKKHSINTKIKKDSKHKFFKELQDGKYSLLEK